MTALSVEAPPRRLALLRSGLVLAGVLAALDLVTGIMAVAGAFFAPPEIGWVMIAFAVVTLALIPPAWSGRRTWPAWIAALLRLLASATGLPAFFVSGVPLPAIVAAAAGIVLAVAAAVLVAFGVGGRR